MNVSYRREMKYNYMMIEPQELSWQTYECQMLESNVIEGLLKFQVRQSNGNTQFYYEITSRQPLKRLLETRTISGEEIRRLVIGIANVLDQMERFLLGEGTILLKPEYVYVEPDSFRVWLCLVPGLNMDFPEEYGKLLEYILGKVDHQDKDSVVLAYGLYQETRKDNYGMTDILSLMQKNAPPASLDQGKAAEPECIREVPVRIQQDCPPARDAPPKKQRLWTRIQELFAGQGRRVKKPAAAEPVQIPWQAMFLEEEEAAQVSETPIAKPLARPNPPPLSLPSSDFLPTGQGTVLLSDISSQEVMRTLRALDRDQADISLAYYPFIIGKQENMVDYVLNHESVSRLHLRIDRMGEEHQIMDLNSTNGTIVRGKLLENNEAVSLCLGDEVQIAKYRYRFE